jgi:hypothetical protein
MNALLEIYTETETKRNESNLTQQPLVRLPRCGKGDLALFNGPTEELIADLTHYRCFVSGH